MSLYNHIASKDDLLDGPVGRVFSEIALPPDPIDWKTAMRQREFADRRRLLLETADGAAPTLAGAELLTSDAGRHEYVFDAGQVKIAALLAQAAEQATVLDVETHRAPIDDVIADIYERWQHEAPAAAATRAAPEPSAT
jgi:hypothetical protein